MAERWTRYFFPYSTFYFKKSHFLTFLGCSSLLGALTENGPIELNADGTLSPNAYAWNSQASILFLESPAGVGFSFNAAQNYSTNDDATAALNYGALQSFYAKFPHLVNNDFYIAGESYGGTLKLPFH